MFEDPKSDTCLNLVRTWLAKCTKTHPKCRGDWHFEKPTRLIDVGLNDDSRKCYLYTTDVWTDMFTEYATLSHCWGNDTTQMVRLKHMNMEQMQQTIDVSSLSQTFKDAIEIARGLNIPYIWIDALCIIQDSVDDWSKESPRMGQYYRGGKVMISAIASSSSQLGILQPRVPALPPVKLEIDGKNAYLRVALDAVVTVQQFDPWNEVRDALSVTPLRSRGWTLQEGLFAPRIIHFTLQQLVFQCKTCMTSEDNQYHWDCHNPKIRPYAKFMDLETSAKDSNGKPGPRKKVKDTGWYSMVRAFSNRQLSFMSDMLPAVSGLAREVHELTGSSYLAGLWKESPDAFIHNLVWYVDYPPHEIKNPLPPRRTLNGSPSWSWASILGSVEFDKTDELFHRLQQPHVDPRFLLMQTHASTGNQYGQVQGGRIAVVGTCHVYNGPLTFAVATARQKAKEIQKAEEKIRRKREKRFREVKSAEEVHVKVRVNNEVLSEREAYADDTKAAEAGDTSTEEDKDSDISDDNIYLAKMDWETPDRNFDFEAYDAANVEKDYGHHTLRMDVPNDDYEWTAEHLILFLGQWDAYPFEEKNTEGVGEQWFMVLKRVESRDGEWDEHCETHSGIRTVYGQPDWRSEFLDEGGEGVQYYERVGIAEAQMAYQLPITEEEGWTRRKFYFV